MVKFFNIWFFLIFCESHYLKVNFKVFDINHFNFSLTPNKNYIFKESIFKPKNKISFWIFIISFVAQIMNIY